ncbi:hypothetical protein [Sphingomonas jaspsi]|uniref:hypothetical protein n=1 Tax=Sphingomonas jaspsi TaxID=392409 RepID=UPI0012EC208A|nr:hypothetical protein [Sphingomonas jaspsi]
MILLTALGFFPSLFGLGAPSNVQPEVVRRVVIQDEVIFRIPIRPRTVVPIVWDEHKGPKCIPAGAIAGALLSGASSIDFVLRDRSRVRAKMDSDCQALDYYGQFYLQPENGMVCAKRDVIRSRIGGTCRIDKFRKLTPKIAE